MKAIVFEKYGSPDVLEFKEVEKPSPGDNDVLIKVHASSINAADRRLLRADPFIARLYTGIIKPKFKILGADIAGRVEAVGKNIKQFRPGDEVFGDLSICGWGGFAEYVCASEDALCLKPACLTFNQAAAIPLAAITALQGLRDKGKIHPRQKILISGAGGGVGTFAVQIAKSFDAEVTAVCGMKNLELMRSLGADHVIDYKKEDFTRNGRGYDLIIGVNGYHSLSDYKRALNPGGIYVMIGGSNSQIFQSLLLGPLVSIGGKRKLSSLAAKFNQKDLNFVKDLIEAGKVKPVIDRCYQLYRTAEAFRYMEEEHARGKVIVSMID